MEQHVKFHRFVCARNWARYVDSGEIALSLVAAATDGDSFEGEPIAKATVNIEHPIPPHCIAVKDYSENDGMVEALVAAGVIESEQVAVHQVGHVVVPIHRLTAAAEAECKAALT